MVDLNKIRGQMAYKRVTGVELASKLEISQTSFYKKINGQRQFTANELGMITTVLEKEVNFFIWKLVVTV